MAIRFNSGLRFSDVIGAVLFLAGIGVLGDLAFGDPAHIFSEKGMPTLLDVPVLG